MLQWALVFIAASAVAFVVFMLYQNRLDREGTLLDEPIRVVAGRKVTRFFTIPANTTYEMNIYVRDKVPYADCLLGQSGSKCARYARAIDVVWTLRGTNGSVLRHGVSGGTCCAYTSDEQNHPLVYSMLDAFKLPSETAAHLELRYNRNLGKLTSLDPRIVVERSSESAEAERVVDVFAFLAISLTAAIGVLFLVIVALRQLATMRKASSGSLS